MGGGGGAGGRAGVTKSQITTENFSGFCLTPDLKKTQKINVGQPGRVAALGPLLARIQAESRTAPAGEHPTAELPNTTEFTTAVNTAGADNNTDNTNNTPDPPPTLAELKAEYEQIQTALRKRYQQELDKLERAKERKIAGAARASLAEFVRQAWHTLHPGETLDWNWHLDAICDHLQSLAISLLKVRGDRRKRMADQNFLINVPPRTLKTEITGVFFPAWVWLRDPTIHTRYVTSSERVRFNVSRDSRKVISSRWFQESFKPGWDIDKNADNVNLFENTKGGKRYNGTYQSSVIGTGTDIIIVDDPIDADDAYSEVIRKNVNDRWDRTFENRVNHRRACLRIGIMQRLHEADFSGHVLVKRSPRGGNLWRHICLPMEYEAPPGCDCGSDLLTAGQVAAENVGNFAVPLVDVTGNEVGRHLDFENHVFSSIRRLIGGSTRLGS